MHNPPATPVNDSEYRPRHAIFSEWRIEQVSASTLRIIAPHRMPRFEFATICHPVIRDPSRQDKTTCCTHNSGEKVQPSTLGFATRTEPRSARRKKPENTTQNTSMATKERERRSQNATSVQLSLSVACHPPQAKKQNPHRRFIRSLV